MMVGVLLLDAGKIVPDLAPKKRGVDSLFVRLIPILGHFDQLICYQILSEGRINTVAMPGAISKLTETPRVDMAM